jgi:hypothetical protein
MQRYIEQLIEDIHKATWDLKPPHPLWEESGADPDNELELEDMSYVEKYIDGDMVPISDITGIGQEQLPPPEQLSQEQQALLATELEKLLQYFHFRLDFPLDYPAHMRYSFIWDFWEEEHVPLSFGESHIEFCEYDEELCPFPGYCNSCREVAEQMKFDEDHGKLADFEIDPELLLPTRREIENFFRGMEQDKGISNDDGEIDQQPPKESLPF